MTGCSAGTAINGASYRCPYSYDYPYYGTGASSIGTIYGIYDLAGGSWECVIKRRIFIVVFGIVTGYVISVLCDWIYIMENIIAVHRLIRK